MRRPLGGAALLGGLALLPAGAKEIDCAALLAHIRTQASLVEKGRLLEVASESCPRDGAVAYEHAFALERLRKYPEALRRYRAASELDPRNGKAVVGVGDTLMLLGDPAGAVAAYEKGLALDPANERAQNALELARIKARAQRGEAITSGEFVKVMTKSEAKGGPAESAEGPLVRMQILFRTGSAALDDGSLGKLKVVGEALRAPALAGARLEITGHTDDTGDVDGNLRLSRDRAAAVRDHLVRKRGVSGGRLVVAYFGQGRPIAPNDGADNRRLNRRVEFRLLQ